MKPTRLLLASSLLCCAVVSSARSLPTPAAITRDIQTIGAKQTVNKLTNSGNGDQWEMLLSKVESGDARWLAVANALADGADAGEAEALRVSVAMALPRNPGSVLKMVDTNVVFPLAEVCGAPFVEPAPDFYLRYLKDTQRALVRFKDAVLDGKKRRCLVMIDKLLSDELSRSR